MYKSRNKTRIVEYFKRVFKLYHIQKKKINIQGKFQDLIANFFLITSKQENLFLSEYAGFFPQKKKKKYQLILYVKNITKKTLVNIKSTYLSL